MDKVKLVAIMAELSFPPGENAIFGGACLAMRSIRTTSDLEIFVSDKLYQNLKEQGWEERVAGSTGASYLTTTVQGVPVLVFITCGSERWRPNAQAYLKKPELVDGLPCMPLEDMYAWKAATARPKDLVDLKLIEDYWQTMGRALMLKG